MHGSLLSLCKPWAYEARDFLRTLTVGKEVTFTSSHQLPPGEGDIPRDLGNGEVNGVDITNELLLNGWTKVKDLKREPTEDDLRRKGIESEARSAGRGQWNPHGPKVGTSVLRLASQSSTFLRRARSSTTCLWIRKGSSRNGRGSS
jgi:staphylococcal nuclease domain-containing protein 1